MRADHRGVSQAEAYRWPRSNRDDDLSSRVSLFEIADGLGRFAQWVRSVDDRCDLPGLQELLQENQVLFRELRDEEQELLTDEPRQDGRSQGAIHGSDPTAAGSSDNHVRPRPGKGALHANKERFPPMSRMRSK